ncbi:MAG: ArsR family transcriptional regulator, partial [Candidatus Electrothrix sp. ATG2]|nr:ArsR family transcriptional regulator [Candidatus Electrothrix sp. ATG2]
MRESPSDPSQRAASKSIRQGIMELLQEEEVSALEISQALGIPEKEVSFHLGHIEQTLAGKGKKLLTRPFSCLHCGFT